MTTFWPVNNPGVRYVRADLPARALDARTLDFDDVVEEHGEAWLDQQDGVPVWGLVANRIRTEALSLSLRKAGAAIIDVDDDYTEWDEQYARGPWQDAIPDDPFIASVQLHRRVTQAVSAVTVSTSYLAERYSTLNNNVHVCPNSVDPADWPELPERDEILRIGFAGAYNSIDGELVRKACVWAARQPNVEVYVFGSKVPWPGVRSVPWTNDLDAYRQKLVSLRLDVGLRPLATTRFARSKSDLKILEYAMAGAWPLVTPWTPYQEWYDSGTDTVGFARTDSDWLARLKDAVADRDEVRQRAARLREFVIRTRTPERTCDAWETALASVSSDR